MAPLISCLMPTRERRPLIALAIHCWLSQDYPGLELRILEDGPDNISDLIPDDPRIHYARLEGPARHTGTKLNILIRNARGEICVQWDDDDWSAPTRVTDQANRLLSSSRQVTGYDTILYWDCVRKLARRYKWPRPSPYVLGTSQMYYRAWGVRHPYRDITRGSDTAFSSEAAANHQVTSADPGQLMVARYHRLSAWQNPHAFESYPLINAGELPAAFFADLRACGQE